MLLCFSQSERAEKREAVTDARCGYDDRRSNLVAPNEKQCWVRCMLCNDAVARRDCFCALVQMLRMLVDSQGVLVRIGTAPHALGPLLDAACSAGAEQIRC